MSTKLKRAKYIINFNIPVTEEMQRLVYEKYGRLGYPTPTEYVRNLIAHGLGVELVYKKPIL